MNSAKFISIIFKGNLIGKHFKKQILEYFFQPYLGSKFQATKNSEYGQFSAKTPTPVHPSGKTLANLVDFLSSGCTCTKKPCRVECPKSARS
jgi:hypothetical protein